MRCSAEPANPVLCNQCTADVKAEYQALFQKVVKYVEKEDVDTEC
jgi:hypothetical protein